ncbi:MAG: TolC family protein [Candidatus Hydrogenedentota bacterium]
MSRPKQRWSGVGAWMGIAVFSAGIVLGGCTTTHYKESADEEVYSLIEEKQPAVPGMVDDYEIETDHVPDLESYPVADEAEEFLGDTGQEEVGAAILSLEDALAIAFRNSRTYQNQKESLYLEALGLTLDRHQYTPRFFGGADATLIGDTRDEQRFSAASQAAQSAPGLVEDIGQLAGTPSEVLSRYSQVVESAGRASGLNEPDTVIVDERRVSGGADVGADMLIRGGASIAADLTSNFLTFLTGDPRTATSSALAATIQQPLLRGAGQRIADEALKQAERDLLYALRDFTRFRQEFAVQIATEYYRVLQSRDTARNNWLGYQSFLQGAERQRALAEAGRLTETDLGRSVQAELSAEDSWTGSVLSYRESLDQFKIQLGLSTDADIVLDDTEMEQLRETGLIQPEIAMQEAVDVALASRLDFYTDRDAVEDAARRVDVAVDGLRPRLDAQLAADVPSNPGDDTWDSLDLRRTTWRAGLNFDPALDRKSERNQFRSALINYERALRNLELAEDNIKLDVRRAFRDLEEAERSYEIRNMGVEVNESRVREQELLAEAGRATTLDQIDAQNDLVSARNSLTAALINHTLSRLSFWRDLGLLHIKEDGQWEEVDHVEQL